MNGISKKSVLVTGADGFIGSHLVESLVRTGARVRAFVYYNSFGSAGWLDTVPPEVRENLEIVAGDIRDPSRVTAAMTGIETVFHLAALIGIPYSYVAPRSYIETNVTGTVNVLEAARALGTERVLHTSTSEVYGTAQYVPITESHPLNAQSPYAASKIGADQMVLSYHRSFGVPALVVRPFNTYGPRQSSRAVIPTVISQILDGAPAIKIGAVAPTRDFTFVRDTAAGFVALASAESAVGEVVQLGSNFEISIGETIDLIRKLLGSSIPIEEDRSRLRPAGSEVERLWADPSKMFSMTSWRPEFATRTGFEKGLKETIDWFSDPKNRARSTSVGYQI